MAKKRRMPIALQRQKLEDRFCKYNIEDCGIADIDWTHDVDKTLTYSENLENLASIHPQYSWEKPPKITARTYETMVIEGLRSEAEPYSYSILKGSKVKKLERKGKKADRLAIELAECQAEVPARRKVKPRRCRVKTVRVPEHWRCAPK